MADTLEVNPRFAHESANATAGVNAPMTTQPVVAAAAPISTATMMMNFVSDYKWTILLTGLCIVLVFLVVYMLYKKPADIVNPPLGSSTPLGSPSPLGSSTPLPATVQAPVLPGGTPSQMQPPGQQAPKYDKNKLAKYGKPAKPAPATVPSQQDISNAEIMALMEDATADDEPADETVYNHDHDHEDSGVTVTEVDE